MSKIKDSSLAEEGKKHFEWAKRNMPALVKLSDKYEAEKPLKGLKIGVCLHITKETSVLIDSLFKAGAELFVAAANPLSTNDSVASYLATFAEVWAWRGETEDEYKWCISQVLEANPDQVIDDGADLHVSAHERQAIKIRGGTEETTTGVIRLKALENEGKLVYPIIAVNDSRTKFLFDNRYGTGQSTIDGILRATSLLLAGKKFAVVGYGWVGRGIALRARGMGCRVYVAESDPIKALEAHLDGFEVKGVSELSGICDIFVTATGQKNVITYEDISKMKEGTILANAGHFDVEIDVSKLYERSKNVKEVRPNVEEIELENGKRIYLLCKGRVVNLVAAEGHPPEVMQMSFANQLEATIYISKMWDKLQPRIYKVPEDVELNVAKAAIDAYGISLTELTEEQKRYYRSWKV